SSIEQEVKMAELKEEALEYKKQITSATNSVKKQLSLDELEEIKSSTKDISDSIRELKEDALETKKSIQDPMSTNRIIKDDKAEI
ncbi:MAG: Sec-independent protein translocase TatB, partial [Campylobacteraceae bacterium]|nr:Sec-independent protein translocase TatB [Campylobacteraceae bacterium]